MKKIMIISLLLLGTRHGDVYAQQSIDAYVKDSSNNTFKVIAGSSNSVTTPVDIDFYPDQGVRPFELWILNQGTSSSGGSTVIVSKANEINRTYKYVKDGNAWHFMALPSAIAFGDTLWATSADILDANHGAGRYTGPTLWPGNLSIYGVVGNPSSQTVNGSHLDMIHQSPYSKGIAHEKNMVYWVLDGYEGNLKRYDFVHPHQPGGSDHSAGEVRVYSDFYFQKHSSLPSHIVIDAAKKYLYGCDPVGKKIFRVDITTGSKGGAWNMVNNEPLASYDNYTGIDIKNIITTGLVNPVGIDVYGDRLIVTDNATAQIIIYDIASGFKEIGRFKPNHVTSPDLMGIKVGPDGKIYFTDKANQKVVMIENSAVLPLQVLDVNRIKNIPIFYPNPSSDFISTQIPNGEQSAELRITNILGDIILNKNIKSGEQVDISNLISGSYLIQLKMGDSYIFQKFMKN